MKKTAIGPRVATPLSMGIKSGNLVFISGQVPIDFEAGTPPPEGIEAQTRMVLGAIRDLLVEAGATMDDVVKVTVFLTDIANDFQAMNRVYAEFFPDPKPARSTFGVELAVDVRIEVEAIAVV